MVKKCPSSPSMVTLLPGAWLTHRDWTCKYGREKATHNPHGSHTHRTLFLFTIGLVFTKILIHLLLSRCYTLIHWIVLSKNFHIQVKLHLHHLKISKLVCVCTSQTWFILSSFVFYYEIWMTFSRFE